MSTFFVQVILRSICCWSNDFLKTLFPDDTVDVDEYGQPREYYSYENNHDLKVENMILTA